MLLNLFVDYQLACNIQNVEHVLRNLYVGHLWTHICRLLGWARPTSSAVFLL
jgi:hypothetical protein